MTGQQAADVIYNNDKENADKIPPTIPGKNLFDPSAVQVDKFQSSVVSSGVDNGVGWSCSDYIPVAPGPYVISGNKQRTGVGFYDASKTCVRYQSINLGLITVQSGEAFVVFNLESPELPGYSDIQFEAGSTATDYQPFGVLVPTENVEGLQGAIDAAQEALNATSKLSAFDVEEVASDNKLNPNDVTEFALLNLSDGSLQTNGASANYSTSGYIPVTEGLTYTFLNTVGSQTMRKVAYYDAGKTFLSGLDFPGFSSAQTTPTGAAFMRVSFPSTNLHAGYTPDKMGLFEGVAPEWQPFTGGYVVSLVSSVPTDDKGNDAVATIEDVKNIAAQQAVDPDAILSYSVSPGQLTVTYPEGSITGRVNEDRGFSGNSMFDLVNYNLKGVATANGDDVAPQHIYGTTLGANHGNPAYRVATATAHGLDNTAIGTEWVNGDGTKFYVMRIIDADTIGFLSENTGTVEAPTFVNLTAGTLTKGASTLDITAVTSAQLYPSLGVVAQKVVRDGIAVITEETGKAQYLDIVETYEIYDPVSVLEAVKGRAGTSAPADFTGAPSVRVKNLYRFLPNMAVVVIQDVRYLAAIKFSDIMTSQAIILGGLNDMNTKYYVPNGAADGVYDFRKPAAFNWTADNPSYYGIVATAPDPNNPPHRVVMYRGDLGFMITYMTDRGAGKDIPGHTARTFEIRNNTGKIYPHPVDSLVGDTTAVDQFHTIAMARVYCDLSVARVGNRLSVFHFAYEGTEYVYLDYSGDMTDTVNLAKDALNGKTVTVASSKNATLETDQYNDGFTVKATYVEGETCFIELTIK